MFEHQESKVDVLSAQHSNSRLALKSSGPTSDTNSNITASTPCDCSTLVTGFGLLLNTSTCFIGPYKIMLWITMPPAGSSCLSHSCSFQFFTFFHKPLVYSPKSPQDPAKTIPPPTATPECGRWSCLYRLTHSGFTNPWIIILMI